MREINYVHTLSSPYVLQKPHSDQYKFNARWSGYDSERRISTVVEITQSKSHYGVQGYSRSPILVPINRKPIYDFLLVINTNLYHQYHRKWYINKK